MYDETIYLPIGLKMRYGYSNSDMNQNLVVSELKRVFYDTAYYDSWTIVIFIVKINVFNFAVQLIG